MDSDANKKKLERAGSLCAPDRHTINWQNEEYYDSESLLKEMDRVFDICHGCRRCVNLCQSFPTLFDLIDEASSGDLEPENHRPHYGDVAEECYLCDRCYMNKCPYTPPHEWAVDFPHIMLQFKAQRFKQTKPRFRDKMLTSTEVVGKLAGIPVVRQVVNKFNHSKVGRRILDKTFDIHQDAPVPNYHNSEMRKKPVLQGIQQPVAKVVLFTTCYGNYNEPNICKDLIKVFEHNQIEVVVPANQVCCGMPKFELGDLETVAKIKQQQVETLLPYVKKGFDIVAPVPSCVLMFKQELPLMFPEDKELQQVRNATYDPFEYLVNLHKQQKFKTDFKTSLGDIAYHIACHLEVQNIGPKTQQILKLIPDTKISAISRCSGHDGTYAVKKEHFQDAAKIGRPVFRHIDKTEANYYSSDCPMAAAQIETHSNRTDAPMHPISLLRKAYGI